MRDSVGIGMLGTGFIGQFHHQGLRHVPAARPIACFGRDQSRREAFAARNGYARAYDSIEGVCADPAVDLVIVSLPNELHLEAVQLAARHGKGVACTKPLGRTGQEAAAALAAVTAAGVWHGYLENVVFGVEMVRMREVIEAGGIGRPVTFRAREAHSGPHAPHFWDAQTAGGGALLDMASHGIEAARYLFGKDLAVREAFAWGDTLVHGDRTTAEDNAVMIMRFEDGRAATMDVSWSSKGGLEGRFEVAGTGGRLISDIASTVLRAFIERPAGYLAEKVDADTGWVFPVPDETYAHGHDAMLGHMVDAFRSATPPRETFHDGLAVNRILDAAYASMRSGRWEPVAVAAGRGSVMTTSLPVTALTWIDRARELLERLAATQADAIEQASQWCADAIGGGGLVHLFGTGHSRIPVEEMFPRYGSYPGFHPLVELSMTFHTQVVGANGQRQAMFIERVPGLAEVILSNFTFGPSDVMMVFSASGLTAVPVEMARGAHRRGLRVIAVTSVAQSMSAEPGPEVGARLLEEADLVIDLCTPPGDAMVHIEGLDTPVGPGSTVTNVAIVNSIKVRTAQLLTERGAMPPVITRASEVGTDRSRELFDAAYDEHARRIARAIDKP